MKIFLTFFIFLFFYHANAADGPPLKLSAGIGSITKNNLRFDNNYHRADSEVIFTTIPFLTLNYGPLNIGGGGINFSILGDREKSLYLNLNRQGENYYANNMHPRHSSWFFGVGIKYNDFNFTATRDINGNSHGNKLALSYFRIHIYNDYIFRSSFSADYFNHQYSNYYYGVSTYEVSSNRVYFDCPDYFQFGVSSMLIKKFMDKINFSFGLSIKNVPSKVKKSPTVKGTDVELTMINGLTWTFY